MSVYENPLKEGRVSDPPLSQADELFYPFLGTRSTTSCGSFGIRRKNHGIALDLGTLLHS